MFSALYSAARAVQTFAPTVFSWAVPPPVAVGFATAAIANDIGHRYIPSFPGLRSLTSMAVNVGSVALGTGVGFLSASILSPITLPFTAVKIGYVATFAFIVPRTPAIYSYVRSWIPFRKKTDRKE